MGELYDDDILLWSERQADLLRRIAGGEPVNEQPDWVNIIEEVESVGRGDLRALRALPSAMDGQPPQAVSPACRMALDELLG